MRKITLVLTALASLAIASTSQAAIGWTLDECKSHFHDDHPLSTGKDDLGLDQYMFNAQGFRITVAFDETEKVISVMYLTPSFEDGDIDKILKNNAPNAKWEEGSNHGVFADTSKPAYWFATENGKHNYFAVLTSAMVFGTPMKRLQVSSVKINDLIEQSRKSSDL
jgi:hypothetical protein